jgi:hypothetical protein
VPLTSNITWAVGSDCYATLTVLSQRQGDGTESVSSASWDVTTQGGVAPELRELSSLALALRD